MKKICVLTDSSSTFSFTEAQAQGISLLPLNIIDEDGNDHLDDLSIDEIGERMLNGENLRTSTTPLGVLVAHINELLQEYDQVVYLAVSSKISSQFSQVSMLVHQFEPEKLFVFDSQTAGYSLEYLSILVKKQIQKHGFDKQVIEDLIHNFAQKNFNLFICQTVKYIARSGRGGKKLIGYLSKIIRPLIMFTDQNNLVGAYPSLKMGISRMVRQVTKKIGDNFQQKIEQIVIYVGLAQEEHLSQLKSELLEKIGFKLDKILVKNAPKAVFVHTGPQTYGLSIILK